jgi:integrase
MMTLSDFIDTTYLEVKKLRWRGDSTTATSLGILNNHLKAALGPKLIHLITRKELQALLQKKANDGCSYSLVQHIHSFMGEIFEMALADRLIQVNPARTTVIPKCKEPKAKPTLTPEDIERAEKSLYIRDRLIFRLDTTEGLRLSEVTGLKVEDAGEDRIHIVRRNYRFSLNDPKNRRSNRVIPLTSRTAALLKEYRKLLVDYRPNAWLFPSENPASPMDYRNVFRRYIKPALVRCGLVVCVRQNADYRGYAVHA